MQRAHCCGAASTHSPGIPGAYLPFITIGAPAFACRVGKEVPCSLPSCSTGTALGGVTSAKCGNWRSSATASSPTSASRVRKSRPLPGRTPIAESCVPHFSKAPATRRAFSFLFGPQGSHDLRDNTPSSSPCSAVNPKPCTNLFVSIQGPHEVIYGADERMLAYAPLTKVQYRSA